MVVVLEIWHLRPSVADDALSVLCRMDELLAPNAHQFDGYAGHARFFQCAAEPSTVHMMYAWADIESHRRLLESERALLAPFHREYCTREREVQYFYELPVDVDASDPEHPKLPRF